MPNAANTRSSIDGEFSRGLGLFDSTMLVVGVMIGSGIFIVSAEMSRNIGSAGWLLVAWAIAGGLTIAGALCYGELSAMMPQAGGMYVYLREAYSPLFGFLYGWTLFTVIQTGTIAAVAVAFARFTGVLLPRISEGQYLVKPVLISSHYAVSLSTAQLLAIAIILLLTFTNTRGLRYGKAIQNTFTLAKTAALLALIAAGVVIGRNGAAWHANFGDLWHARGFSPLTASLDAGTAMGMFVALCLSQTGSLFFADSWHNIAFAAGEVRNLERNVTRGMVIGTILVITLYLLANFAYFLTLPLEAITLAPSDCVGPGTMLAIFYVLTVAAVFRLRSRRPDMPRPYRTWGYPIVPAAYILTAATILLVLFAFRPATTWPGLLIVILGIPVYWLVRTKAEAAVPAES